MDKARESLDDAILDNEFHPEAFIRMGQSLDMPGEIDKEELKAVPKYDTLGSSNGGKKHRRNRKSSV